MPRRKYFLPLFFLFQVIVVKTLSFFPETVETAYSNRLYVFFSKVWRMALGWVPFSVGDVMYGIILVLALRWLWKRRRSWRQQWKDNLLRIAGTLSVIYFFFHLFWGMNYYRIPLHEKMGFERDYSEADLRAFTQRLIQKTNEAHRTLTGDDSAKVAMPYTHDVLFAKSVGSYARLSEVHPFLRYDKPSVKSSLYSLPLTYMGFAGYLNPFTGEAQVNDKLPMYTFPMTTCHEMAHQIGYASESEANFIGFLANVHSDDPYLRYSGYAYALRYCLNTLEAFREGSARPYLEKVHFGIRENFRESREFWEAYDTFLDGWFEAFYDTFLKANSQADGMEGYSRFVDLMVNYYRERPL